MLVALFGKWEHVASLQRSEGLADYDDANGHSRSRTGAVFADSGYREAHSRQSEDSQENTLPRPPVRIETGNNGQPIQRKRDQQQNRNQLARATGWGESTANRQRHACHE